MPWAGRSAAEALQPQADFAGPVGPAGAHRHDPRDSGCCSSAASEPSKPACVWAKGIACRWGCCSWVEDRTVEAEALARSSAKNGRTDEATRRVQSCSRTSLCRLGTGQERTAAAAAAVGVVVGRGACYDSSRSASVALLKLTLAS